MIYIIEFDAYINFRVRVRVRVRSVRVSAMVRVRVSAMVSAMVSVMCYCHGRCAAVVLTAASRRARGRRASREAFSFQLHSIADGRRRSPSAIEWNCAAKRPRMVKKRDRM